MKSRLMVFKSWWLGSVGKKWGMTVSGYWVSFWGDENVSKLIVVMGIQLSDYTKKSLNLHYN